jgi:glycerol-3-phosphate dehydrogenase (NAD(P)+)
MEKITALGGGSWGTALANLLAEKGYSVTLWVYEKDLAEAIARTRENALYLPNVKLPSTLAVTHALQDAATDASIILNVIPTQHIRTVFSALKGKLPHNQVVVSASKGIEKNSLLTVTGILNQLFGESIRQAAFAGPSFAKEVAQKHPTAITLASSDLELAKTLQKVFNADFFRVYTNDDIMGVELGGALKNVIALAAGISDGLGFGDNTRAALITRGLAEIVRLGLKMGAKQSTFSGLSGIGDLFLTCTGAMSRNRSVGLQIGQGKKLGEILASMTMVAEGVETAISARDLAVQLNVDMPIVNEVYKMLYEDKPPRQAVKDLMTREYRREFDS